MRGSESRSSKGGPVGGRRPPAGASGKTGQVKVFRRHEAGLPLLEVGHLDRNWGSRARDPGSFSRGGEATWECGRGQLCGSWDRLED